MTQNALIQIMVVGSGGFAGSIMRYWISGLLNRMLPLTSFPAGTFVVNIAGCFLIGLFAGIIELNGLLNPYSRLFLIVGVLGGFTTFSTLGYECYSLLNAMKIFMAFLNLGLHISFGLLAVWGGQILARLVT